jgi:hypothetical protein
MLVIDGRAPAGEDCARSRREALERIIENEYDTIVLHTAIAGHDEYDLVVYLADIWPVFFQQITIRTVTPGASSYEWNHEKACFEAWSPPPRKSRGLSRQPQPPSLPATDSLGNRSEVYRHRTSTPIRSSIRKPTPDDANQLTHLQSEGG